MTKAISFIYILLSIMILLKLFNCCKNIDVIKKSTATADFLQSLSIIKSTSNSKVQLLSNVGLNKSKFTTNLDGRLILVEGHRQVIEALSTGLKPHTLLVTEDAFSSPRGADLYQSIYNAQISHSLIALGSEKVLNHVCDVTTNQGVVAAFWRPRTWTVDEVLQHCRAVVTPLIVIADGISDPGNMGTLIRSSFGFGADIFIAAGGTDVWAPKTLRASMGASFKLPILEDLEWDDIARIASGGQVVLADAKPNSKPYVDIDLTKSTTLIIGSEATGVSDAARTLPEAFAANIPMSRELESLNAGIAGAIFLGEASRQRMLAKKS